MSGFERALGGFGAGVLLSAFICFVMATVVHADTGGMGDGSVTDGAVFLMVIFGPFLSAGAAYMTKPKGDQS